MIGVAILYYFSNVGFDFFCHMVLKDVLIFKCYECTYFLLLFCNYKVLYSFRVRTLVMTNKIRYVSTISIRSTDRYCIHVPKKLIDNELNKGDVVDVLLTIKSKSKAHFQVDTKLARYSSKHKEKC